ncbi:MAG: RluA family pseudouridine synthase [Bacteroidia bacterium]
MEEEIKDQEPGGENDELYEHYRIKVDRGQQPLRIDRYLTQRIQNVSRNRLQNAAKADCILVNGEAVKSNYKVKPLDEVSIVLPEPPRDKEVYPENIPLDIIYEDEHLLVLNKAAGMVVHPGFNNYTGTLVNALVYHFDNLPTHANGEIRPGLVHRIDKDTTGVMVVAKEEYAMSFLARQFFDHSIERAYTALVWGDVAEDSGTIRGNLGRSKHDRRMSQVYQEEEIGKPAVTHYKVLERFTWVTLVECRLETGRTHQIRAHMRYLGHPLFADELYGGMRLLAGTPTSRYKQFIENCFKLLPRQALHARSLGFIHPHSKKHLHFEQALPQDMQAVIEKWRTYINAKFGDARQTEDN